MKRRNCTSHLIEVIEGLVIWVTPLRGALPFASHGMTFKVKAEAGCRIAEFGPGLSKSQPRSQGFFPLFLFFLLAPNFNLIPHFLADSNFHWTFRGGRVSWTTHWMLVWSILGQKSRKYGNHRKVEKSKYAVGLEEQARQSFS